MDMSVQGIHEEAARQAHVALVNLASDDFELPNDLLGDYARWDVDHTEAYFRKASARSHREPVVFEGVAIGTVEVDDDTGDIIGITHSCNHAEPNKE